MFLMLAIFFISAVCWHRSWPDCGWSAAAVGPVWTVTVLQSIPTDASFRMLQSRGELYMWSLAYQTPWTSLMAKIVKHTWPWRDFQSAHTLTHCEVFFCEWVFACTFYKALIVIEVLTLQPSTMPLRTFSSGTLNMYSRPTQIKNEDFRCKSL